jgi:hypothetical protein
MNNENMKNKKIMNTFYENFQEEQLLLGFVGKVFHGFEVWSVRNPKTKEILGFLGWDTETMVIRYVYEKESDSFSSELKYELFEKLMYDLVGIKLK